MGEARSDIRRDAAGGIFPTEEDRAAARRLLDELGEAGAATKLGVARASVQKVAAGSPVRYGTLIAFRFGTGLITEFPKTAAGQVVE
jgi:hypothetical protein